MDASDNQLINPYAPPDIEQNRAEHDIRDTGERLAEPIRVEGSVSREDLEEVIPMVRLPLRAKITLVVIFLGALSMLFLTGGNHDDSRMRTQAICILVVLIVIFIAWFKFRRIRNRAVDDLLKVMDYQKWVISEEGIEITTDKSATKNLWAAYSEYVLSERGAQIFFCPLGSTYWFVPRSFFADEEQWAAFVQLLARKLPQKKLQERNDNTKDFAAMDKTA